MQTNHIIWRILFALASIVLASAIARADQLRFESGEKRDRNLEAPVPARARIGLAGVVFLEFRSTANG